MIVPFILGSEEDLTHAKEIAEVLDDYGIKHEFYIAPVHKVPKLTLEIVESFSDKKESIVFVTIAPWSNALSGLVAGSTQFPVISCPSFSDKSDYLANIHSKVEMPTETPVLTVVDPQNAGQAVARILGLTNKDLMKKVKNHTKVVKRSFNAKPIKN